MNQDHYGLNKVKDRVLEYLAVIERSQELKGPILCLVGPLRNGKDVHRQVRRQSHWQRICAHVLGGVRDEAKFAATEEPISVPYPVESLTASRMRELRTRSSSLTRWTSLVRTLRETPLPHCWKSWIRNRTKFTDHYLEVPFDLSKVMFVTTANTMDTIPAPLLDRMEVIEVMGYTEEEKVKIATKYLVPKKRKEHGLTGSDFKVTEKTIRDIINYYTRESGVRNLEREIANLCKGKVRRIVTDGEGKYTITPKDLEDYLGKNGSDMIL